MNSIVYNKVVLLCLCLIIFIFLFPQISHAQQKPLNLSPNATTAISGLATDILLNGPNPRITALKPQLDPQDYATVKNIGILPDSPWYFFKTMRRGIRMFFTFDTAGKTYQLLKDGNEKTLESLLVVEKAANEKDTIRRERLIQVSTNTLDSVGTDFDSVAQSLDILKKTDPIQGYLVQQEAFQFAGYYLKHQILLQKQEDRLGEQDFLAVEQVRTKHLASIAHIVVSENRDPVIFGEQLSQLLASQVGSNNTQLATIAVLRDLENKADSNEIKPLQTGQTIMQKELEIKLLRLPKAERLKQIEQYITFIHGNPIREFQAYNVLSKSFTSREMTVLTQALKDTAAQDFKKHLNVLDSADIQKQFVQTLFSNYPIDMRLLMYTEIQLTNDKNTGQLERLQAIKSLLGEQICETYGKNPTTLVQTRFYAEATTNPSLLDIRVGEFLNQSLQSCEDKTPDALAVISDLQTKINNSFIAEAKTEVFKRLPTKAQAEEILKKENITVPVQDEQKVAEKIEEETQQIEEELSENPTVLEQEVQQIIESVTTPTQETVVQQIETIINKEETIASDSQAIVEEIIQDTEPTQEEITAKEEQIIEEIVDAAETGETSPLVEELPQEIQEEISKETGVPLPTAKPIPTLAPTVVPITAIPTVAPVAPTTTIIDTVAPVITSVPPTAIQVANPTPIPTVAVPGL